MRGERGPQGDHGQDGRRGERGERGPQGEPGKRENNPFVMVGDLVQNIRFLAAVFLLFGLAALLFQVINNRADDQQLLKIAEEAVAQRDLLLEQTARIIDCTEPGGECFEEGQERTAEAVGSINTVTGLSIVCGQRFTTASEIFDCVAREFRKLEEEQKR